MNENSSQINEQVDCVLIYPPWTVVEGRSFLTNCLPPLGILSIAGSLEEAGFKVALIDIHAERIGPREFEERLRRLRPRHVGITVLSSMVVIAQTIASLVKKTLPSCTVTLGGVHAELYPSRMLRNPSVDMVVRGDGERPMTAIVSGRAASEIPSVSWKQADGTIVHNNMQEIEMDLDKYAPPAYHLIDFTKYFPSATSYRNLPASNMMMTRGCPGKCSFCNSANTVLRSRSPRKVFEQIELLHRKYGVKQIQFYDDTFTVNKAGVMELAKLLKENDVTITMSCYARGDCFSDEVAKALKQSGCHQIMVGIETGSEKIQKVIGKPVDKKRYAETVKIAHAHGIDVRAGFIIGSIGETWETMEESLRFAMELDVDYFQLSISTPYPGTQLFKQALEEGRLKHMEFKRYGQGEALVKLDDLTEEDIYAFERHAWRTFYLRPKQMIRQFARLGSIRQLKDLMQAFMLLIAEKGIDPSHAWSEWDKEVGPEGEDASKYIDEPYLTFEVRKPSFDPACM